MGTLNGPNGQPLSIQGLKGLAFGAGNGTVGDANTLYFTADDGMHGRELWRSDGTASGTALVADLNPGPAPAFAAGVVTSDNATWLDVGITGGRFGALTAHGAGLTRVGLNGVKVDFLDLRGATLVDVTLTGCTVGDPPCASACR